MIGSIIGDIVGSIYEFNNIHTKDFNFFSNEAEYTDDSILTIATADALLSNELDRITDYYARYAENYPTPMGSYGTSFKNWVIQKSRTGHAMPYNSCGNGSAMRVGPVGWAFNTEEETMRAAEISAEGTHNHPEGIKGAQATCMCIFMARKGHTKAEIRKCMEEEFGYAFPLSISELQLRYSWNGVDGKGNGGLCQDSVPQAIQCALQAVNFEDAIRNAISIGGDSDTLGCITGSIAEAIYGIPRTMYNKSMSYLPNNFKKIVQDFETKFGSGLLRFTNLPAKDT